MEVTTHLSIGRSGCPKCGSVFVNQKQCEACGYRLAYNPLGEPFGENSFFGRDVRYRESLNIWERALPVEWRAVGKKHRRYLNFLRRRFELLNRCLKRDSSAAFLLEAKIVVETYALEGGDVNRLATPDLEELARARDLARLRQAREWGLKNRLGFWRGRKTRFVVKLVLMCVSMAVLGLWMRGFVE